MIEDDYDEIFKNGYVNQNMSQNTISGKIKVFLSNSEIIIIPIREEKYERLL